MVRVTLAAVAASMVMVFAGCVSDDGDEAPEAPGAQRWTTEEWKAALTPVRFDGVVSTNHYLEAEDGTQLSLTVHLPAGLGDEQVPTLMEITPYQTFLSVDTDVPPLLTVPGPGGSWRDVVLRGAAYVEADARGTTGSGGCLDFGGSADRSDARTFIAWVREQAWSNGVVVTDGVSHPGMGSVVAHAAEPTLDAALAHAPVVSYYRDEWYQGAKFEDQLNGPAYQAVELGLPIRTDPGVLAAQVATCTGETVLDFNTLDGRYGPLWVDRDLSRNIADGVAAPILLTQGFVDQNVHPDHVQLYWDALPEDFPKHVIWGWWYHGWPDMAGHEAETFADLRLRWLDTVLFGNDNGLWLEPQVLVEDSRGTWHESDTWPLAPSETVTWWTDGEGFAAAAPTDSTASFADGLAVARWHWDDSHVAYRSEPLDGPMLVNGAPRVHLVASSDAAATKWVAYLLDEAPDGSWQRISHGYADSHNYAGEDTWQDLEPGTAYEWDLMLMPTAVVVEAGHRVTLLVASQDSRQTSSVIDVLDDLQNDCIDDYRGGCYDPSGILPAPESIGQATNTVYSGPEKTTLTFAWVDPALTAKAPASG